MNQKSLILCLSIIFVVQYQSDLYPTAYGSDAGETIVNPFNISGPDNIIRTFGCATNGFAFADAATTCSFNSIFPVAGPITFKGGTLRLQKDLILTNTGSFVDLGTIKAQNHAVDLPESVQNFSYRMQPSGAIVLNFVTRTSLYNNQPFSTDWSYDGKFVVIGLSLPPVGSYGLHVYEFTGTSTIERANLGTVGNNIMSVRWRPHRSSDPANTYYFAAAYGNIATYKFSFTSGAHPTYSLSTVNTKSVSGATFNAVAWQGRGSYLAAGGNSLKVFSVDDSGNMSAMVTPTNRTLFTSSTITFDVLKWAPVGNKNNFITGTSNGNFLLYLYDPTSTTSLQLLKNYPQGTNITSLDWAPTSTYIALGFSNGNVKTYQHSASSNTIGLKSTYAGSTVTTRSLSWNNNATQLAAGFYLSASTNYPEFQILSFVTSPAYSLSRLYSIDLSGNVNCVRYSPNGTYISRADQSSYIVNTYKVVTSPFIFEDVKLYFTGGITLGSPLTFKGNCILNARGNLMTLTGDGSINVAPNSNLTIEQTYLGFTQPNAFSLQGSTSAVNFRNTWLELNADILWGDGKFDSYEDLVITGPHIFNYSTDLTSTIHFNSTLTLQKGATFKIGKTSLQNKDPLVLEDGSSQLTFDNATLHVTDSGLKLTKGIINVYNQTNFIIDNLDNTQSCSLILGDSSDPSGGKDVSLLLHGNGTQLSVSSGPIILNSISPYMNEFLGQSKVSISNYCSVVIERPADILSGWISADETTRLIFWPNSYLLCNNTHFSNPVFTQEYEDYYLTGTLTSMDSINLYTDSVLSLNTGVLFQVINVIGSGNLISGFGRFVGYLNFTDSTSEVTWDVNLPIETVESISLNGGRLRFTSDSGFIDGLTFKTTGTIDLGVQTFLLGRDVTTWDGNLYWIGNGGTLEINNNVTLSGTWTLSGNVVIEGNNYLIDLAPSGKIILERGATLTLKDISIYNVSRTTPIVCLDDNCTIYMSIADFFMDGDYEFNKGSLYVYYNSTIGRLGLLDAKYTFSYTSPVPAFIDSDSFLKIWPNTVFSIGRTDSALSAPGDQPLTFGDSTSRLILDSSTLHVTSSGMILTKGEIDVLGGSALEVENNKLEYGLILGDGILEDDQQIRFDAGGQLTLRTGKLIYNNAANDRMVFDSSSSTLAVESSYGVYAQRNMNLANGSVATSEGLNFLDYAPGIFVTASNLQRYDYSHLLDYYVTGTLALLPARAIVLDSNDQVLINPGTFSIELLIKGAVNRVSGIGSVTGALNFTDNNSVLEWDLNSRYAGGDVDLEGGRIIITQDSGLVDGNSFVGTGTVDLTTHIFDFGTTATTWHGNLYWMGNGGIIRLNNDVTLDGTWTLSGDITIEGGFVIDLAPSGKIVLERGAQVTIANLSFYNLSRTNPIVCLDDNCLITLNFMDFLMSGDYEFDKGSLYAYFDSTIGSLGNLDKNYTFSYTSKVGFSIDSDCRFQILPGATLAIGRQDSTITDPNLQPLTFGDSTSILELMDGSALHVTSSGMILTKGILQASGHSRIAVDNYKDEYGLIIGDGTAENDFGTDISGNGGITLEYGKIVYNNFLPNNRFVFQNPSAFIEFGPGSALTINSSLLLNSGYIKTDPSASIYIKPGILLTETDVTEYLAYPYAVFRVTGRFPNLFTTILDDGGYLITQEGAQSGGILCNSGTSYIRGVAGITDMFGPITLRNSAVTLASTLAAPYFTDIVLNGGTLMLQSDTVFADDKKITGSGNVIMAGTALKLGSADATFTDTLYWKASSTSRIDLESTTKLYGNWIVDGSLEINGNGNVLDLSSGGVLTVRPNSTLLFNNVSVKGVGNGSGNIIWNSDNSLVKLSNSYIELSNNFSTTLGGIYVNGPSCVGLGGYNWTLDKNASMTIDGVTLWQDTLDKNPGGKITFGSGNISKYLSLTSSGTIKTAANLDLVEIQIDEVGSDAQAQLNTIDHGPANIHFATDSTYTLTYNLNLSTEHFLHLAANVLLDGAGHSINLSSISGDQIIVDADKTVILTNAIINNFSESAFNIGSNAELIFGDGVVINLDLSQQLLRSWLFSGSVAFGNDNLGIDLTSGGNLIVQSGGNLTLQNLSISGLKTNNIRCQGDNATLTVKNSGLILSSNYSFTSGKIRFVGDVTVSGTNTFVYSPTNGSSGIASNSILLFDLGTTFSYAPSSANRDLLGMDDETAALYINGCTLSSTTTGMRLTKGSLTVGNKNYLRNDGATSVSQGICFGNGTAGGSLYIDILAGGSIDLKSGILDYRNIN